MRKKLPLIDFIGKEVRIINSSCKEMIGTKGKIIDEYKEYFLIEKEVKGKKKGKKEVKEKKIIKVDKKNNVFEINGFVIDGKEIISTPENR